MTQVNIFALLAAEYFAAGMWPYPIHLGTKATRINDWTTQNYNQALLEFLIANYGECGIGIRLGSPTGLPGYVLACLDVDRDYCINPAKTFFGGVVSGKVGKKGITIFVQASEKLVNCEFEYKQIPHLKPLGKVAEFFVREKLTVLPPTNHPEILKPYEWVGTPLLNLDLTTLPIIEA